MPKVSKRQHVIDILKKSFPSLRKDFKVEKIAIFGSVLKSELKDNSDIDIMVDFKQPLGLKFMEFSEHMEKILGRKVDIITSEGLRAIRVNKVSREIKRSLFYV